MSTPSTRQYKVSTEITRVLSQACLQKASDPRLKNIVIKETRISKDLSFAVVYVGVMGCLDQQSAQPVLDALEKANAFFRKIINEEMQLRITPKLDFRFDEIDSEVARIEQLLYECRTKK